MPKLINTAGKGHAGFAYVAGLLQNPLLLAVRLYWGWQFAQDGWGKLHHLPMVTQYFASLNLPMPGSTALFVSLVEFVGGILFAAGLGCRLTALVLFINMTVAYWTGDHYAFTHIISAPDKFLGADPYTYWFAALLILVFGPGLFSLDALLGRVFLGKKRR
jgi:putative oxidoreductase